MCLHTTKQHFIQSTSPPQLSAPILPSIYPGHQLGHSHGHWPIRQQDYSSAYQPHTSSSRQSNPSHSHLPVHPHDHQQVDPRDHPFDVSPNLESKDLPHSIDIGYPRTKTMRSKRARHSSSDTELCNVMISPVFEPRVQKS